MSVSLVVLAAGMGSRYGGLKQIDSFGPNGETILEYSIYDAIRAGFDHVVLVIRESFHDEFKKKLGDRFSDKIRVSYVYQEINPKIPGFDLIAREKPRGTGHAILSAKEVVTGPFAVINADDYYGIEGYKYMYDHLEGKNTPDRCSMVGYILKNTLSENGTVNRGICTLSKEGTLENVEEWLKIKRNSPTTAVNPKGVETPDDGVVSMNFRGFDRSFFDYLEKEFHSFLKEHGNEETYEFFLPSVVNSFIHGKGNACDVLISHDLWKGVSYADDKPFVQDAIKELVEANKYPNDLRAK